MGEIADDCFDRMMDEFDRIDDDYYSSPFSGRQPKGRKGRVPNARFYKERKSREKELSKRKPVDTVTAHEYPSSKTPPHLLQEYPKEKFNLGFFKVSDKKQEPEIKSDWDYSEDSPF